MMTNRFATKKSIPKTPVRLRRAGLAGREEKAAPEVVHCNRPVPRPRTMETHGVDESALICLQRERQRLIEEIARQEFVIQDRPTSATHLADVASEVAEQATGLALRHHLESLLEAAERAMQRVEHGTYGWCERCGEPIDPERLRIVPSTALCIECAQRQVHSPKATSVGRRV